jgi:hypothetical protein
MNRAARDYTRALEDRDSIRRHPPRDVFELQDQVVNYSKRLANSKKRLKNAIATRIGPTKTYVTRPSREGIYQANHRILVRRGTNGPSLAFWNVNIDRSMYLKRQGRDWIVTYGNDAGKTVQLGEHWAPGGLR